MLFFHFFKSNSPANIVYDMGLCPHLHLLNEKNDRNNDVSWFLRQ